MIYIFVIFARLQHFGPVTIFGQRGNLVMVKKLIFILAVFMVPEAVASPLVFNFTNPAFNSQSKSGDYLLEAAGATRGRNQSAVRGQTPTYQIIEINNGAVVLQTGEGNSSSITIQSGTGNSSTTNQTTR